MKTVLCFGDSNTYGLNPKDNSRFDYNTRWTGILDRRLRAKDCRVVEEGLCGRTTVFPMSCAVTAEVWTFCRFFSKAIPHRLCGDNAGNE